MTMQQGLEKVTQKWRKNGRRAISEKRSRVVLVMFELSWLCSHDNFGISQWIIYAGAWILWNKKRIRAYTSLGSVYTYTVFHFGFILCMYMYRIWWSPISKFRHELDLQGLVIFITVNISLFNCHVLMILMVIDTSKYRELIIRRKFRSDIILM